MSSNNSDIAISVKGLTKTYRLFDHPGDRVKQFFSLGLKQYHREFTALKDVSFEIRKGETVGIIGRNGSGKSTLLQLICAILKPTSGSVQVNGRISALLELGAGFNPEFTGRENVYFQGALMGFTESQMNERFDEIAKFADIGEFIERPVRTYSSGMFVRLAFSIMSHVDADILIIDEALAVGDAQFTRKCLRHLQELKRKCTLLIVSHDTTTVTSLCERVVWLDQCGIRRLGDTISVCDSYLMSSLARSNSSDSQIPKTPRQIKNVLLDHRHDIFNNSKQRNDLEVFYFDLSDKHECNCNAKIIEVLLTTEESCTASSVIGGEVITLKVRVKANTTISSPIVGFSVRDWAGRSMFGDNTYLSFPDGLKNISTGNIIEAQFTFIMPRLPVGQYTVAAAVAGGTQSQHVMYDWQPNSLIIKSVSSSTIGDLGLPMIAVTLNKVS